MQKYEILGSGTLVELVLVEEGEVAARGSALVEGDVLQPANELHEILGGGEEGENGCWREEGGNCGTRSNGRNLKHKFLNR